MKITSPAFRDKEHIPIPHTGQGENTSPELRFDDIPEGSQSLVLIVQDRDATPEPWIHWLVFNIPPTTTSVPADTIPDGGTEGIANGGTHGYEGPAPKYFSGTHHYYYQLFALDTTLDLPASADKKQVTEAMENHILDSAILMGLCDGHLEDVMDPAYGTTNV